MEKNFCFGVDIGGTSVKIGLFHCDGTLVDKWEIKTRKEERGKYILADVAESVLKKMEEKNLNREQILGIGLGVPGPVQKDSIICVSVNLGWGVLNVAEELSGLTGFPVKAANDANVAALGEMWQGGGKGYQNIVMVTLGTGVGGGIILNGQIVSGEHGAAGEIGHMTIEPREQEVCNCGKKGCLEQFASATGIVRMAKKMSKEYKENSVLKNQKEISAKSVLDGAKDGDVLCIQIMDQVAYYLGWALANVSVVMDPQAFVIGGGVSKAGDFLIEKIKQSYQKNAFSTSIEATFTIAKLGNDAGIYGAAKLIVE